MTQLAVIFGGIGLLELIVLALLGLGTIAVLGAVVFFAVKAGQGNN